MNHNALTLERLHKNTPNLADNSLPTVFVNISVCKGSLFKIQYWKPSKEFEQATV